MELAKYSIKEIADVALCQFLKHALPGGSLKGLRAHVSANAAPPLAPPDCTERRLHHANFNDIIDIKRTPPSINPAANHHQIVIASTIVQYEPNPVNVSDVGSLVSLSSTLAMANKYKQHNRAYYLTKRKFIRPLFLLMAMAMAMATEMTMMTTTMITMTTTMTVMAMAMETVMPASANKRKQYNRAH